MKVYWVTWEDGSEPIDDSDAEYLRGLPEAVQAVRNFESHEGKLAGVEIIEYELVETRRLPVEEFAKEVEG